MGFRTLRWKPTVGCQPVSVFSFFFFHPVLLIFRQGELTEIASKPLHLLHEAIHLLQHQKLLLGPVTPGCPGSIRSLHLLSQFVLQVRVIGKIEDAVDNDVVGAVATGHRKHELQLGMDSNVSPVFVGESFEQPGNHVCGRLIAWKVLLVAHPLVNDRLQQVPGLFEIGSSASHVGHEVLSYRAQKLRHELQLGHGHEDVHDKVDVGLDPVLASVDFRPHKDAPGHASYRTERKGLYLEGRPVATLGEFFSHQDIDLLF